MVTSTVFDDRGAIKAVGKERYVNVSRGYVRQQIWFGVSYETS